MKIIKRKKITAYRIYLARYKSRRKVESVLRRSLKSGEVVHHIDLNPLNTKNSNLLVCTSKYHRGIHNKLRSLKIKKDHTEEIERLYALGHSALYIGEVIHHHHNVVTRILKKIGIKTRTKSEAWSIGLKEGFIKQSGCFPQNRKYSKKYLIQELRKASVKNKSKSLSRRKFVELSGIPDNAAPYAFGGWNNAKRIADIS